MRSVVESLPERISRWLYGLVGLAALPGLCLVLLWRGMRQPEYWAHWSERFLGRPSTADGFSDWQSDRRPLSVKVLWIHAVSVGETRAAAPLIHQWLSESAQHKVILTHMTPTGRATGREIFSQWCQGPQPALVQCFLPYDFPWATARFLKWARPALGVLMETELWPNLLAQARHLSIPVALINARLSPRSRRRLLKARWLSRPAVAGLAGIAAQTARDAEGFRAVLDARLTASSPQAGHGVQVLGNMKFDVSAPDEMRQMGRQWRERLCADASTGAASQLHIWAAVSTREDEERSLLAAWSGALASGRITTRDRLLIVPRHPQRFERVAQLVGEHGFSVCRRSTQWSEQSTASTSPAARGVPDTSVLLGDSLGEMFAYLEMADLVLIGGSLLPLGGQNPLEACVIGRPVFFGPYMFNFHEIARELRACGAGTEIQRIGEWIELGQLLLNDPKERAYRSGLARDFSQAHRGAAERTRLFIDAILRAGH